MSLRDNEIAVEISILTQHVVDKSDKFVPRLSQDIGVLRLCDELNEVLKSKIPSGVYVLLKISSPLNKMRQTKTDLINKVTEIAQKEAPVNEVFETNRNLIEIKVIIGERPSGKKVVEVVSNHNSSPDILGNVLNILNKTINDKVTKCQNIVHRPLWLVLFNDYLLAEPDIYKLVMGKLSIKHTFDKICLVLRNQEVHILYET